MKAEENIQKTCGKNNPFTGPEGYFEQFTQQLMAQLPEQEMPVEVPRVTTWQRVRPLLYMAALFCGFLLTFRTFLQRTTDDPATQLAETEQDSYSDQYIEDLLDTTMMDDYTIYCYLTDTDTDNY